MADVVSEEAHAYASPAPDGGWTLFDIRASADGTPRFDAGRIVPEGQEESFAIAVAVPAGADVFVRTDDTAVDLTLLASTPVGPLAIPFVRDEPSPRGAWRLSRARVPAGLAIGTRVAFRPTHGELHDFHAWLVGGNP